MFREISTGRRYESKSEPAKYRSIYIDKSEFIELRQYQYELCKQLLNEISYFVYIILFTAVVLCINKIYKKNSLKINFVHILSFLFEFVSEKNIYLVIRALIEHVAKKFFIESEPLCQYFWLIQIIFINVHF